MCTDKAVDRTCSWSWISFGPEQIGTDQGHSVSEIWRFLNIYSVRWYTHSSLFIAKLRRDARSIGLSTVCFMLELFSHSYSVHISRWSGFLHQRGKVRYKRAPQDPSLTSWLDSVPAVQENDVSALWTWWISAVIIAAMNSRVIVIQKRCLLVCQD
jgi:hypothetical protein